MKSQKICAIICEYNPPHNGHKYLIEQARTLSGCDFVMCIMSGNFTQRGEVAILNKHQRAKLALQLGCDVVIHLPTAYACASSEVFALAGVKIANSFKNVTHLCFGSECGDIDSLKMISSYLLKEPKEYKKLLKAQLDLGNSYTTSKLNALTELSKTSKELPENTVELITKSNNILAIEYLKALAMTNSKIEPITVKRVGEEYNSKKVTTYASASAIRKDIYDNKSLKNVSKTMPSNVYEDLKKELETQGLVDLKLFDELRLFKARTTSLQETKEVFDVVEGFENRIYNLSRQSVSFEHFIKDVQTKRYSPARTYRIILGLLLGIDKKIIESLYKIDYLPYAKVLAVRKNKVLNNLQSHSTVILRTNDVKKTTNYVYNKLIDIENIADSIYTQLTKIKVVNVPYITQPPIINSKLS